MEILRNGQIQIILINTFSKVFCRNLIELFSPFILIFLRCCNGCLQNSTRQVIIMIIKCSKHLVCNHIIQIKITMSNNWGTTCQGFQIGQALSFTGWCWNKEVSSLIIKCRLTRRNHTSENHLVLNTKFSSLRLKVFQIRPSTGNNQTNLFFLL